MADYDLQYQDTHIDALLATANELKTAGYIYKGVATPSTNPGTPTERVAYLASEPGTYTNFGGIVIASGLYSLTYAGGTWTATQMQAGSDIEVVQTTGQSASNVMSQKAVTDEIVTEISKPQFAIGGLLAVSTGEWLPYATRALSGTYYKKGDVIVCNEGYYIRGIYRFTIGIGGNFEYVDFISYASLPYSVYYVNEDSYYIRVLLQKGVDGNENITDFSGIIALPTTTKDYDKWSILPSRELGAWSYNIQTKVLSKSANTKRMRSAGVFSNDGGIISVKCKQGYEANIIYVSNIKTYPVGWNDNVSVSRNKDSFARFVLVFRKSNDTTVSSADLDCLDSFTIRHYNSGKQERPAIGYEDFAIKANNNIADDISENLTLQDAETLADDKCRLYVPTQYSENGHPTRLIIHCHGASVNYNQNNFSNLGIDNKVLDYLIMMGYAVLFVNGMAGNNTLQMGTTAGSPLAYQCHVKAYQYVVNKYNICQDGCFVWGISAGSIPALQIANFTDIPVLAQVIYCGIYSVPRAFMLLGGYTTYATQMKQYIADMYDFQGSVTWSTTDPVSDDEWEFILDNVLRFAGWNSFLHGASTRMSQEDYADFVSDYYGGSLPSWIDNQNITFDTIDQLLMAIKVQQKNTQSPSGSLLDAVNAEKKLYKSVSISRNTPIKLFHATNDDIAPYRYAQYYYEMLKRGGCQVEMRTYPSGGHSPYGNSIDQSTFNGIAYTCVMAVEALLWCKRFE